MTITGGTITEVKGQGVVINEGTFTASNLTVSDCKYTSDTGGGAGIRIDGSNINASFTGCTIRGNELKLSSTSGNACGAGICICNSSPTFTSCTIQSNAAKGMNSGQLLFYPYGGGVAVASGSPIFNGCNFISNFAFTNYGPNFYVASGASITVDGTTYSGEYKE